MADKPIPVWDQETPQQDVPQPIWDKNEGEVAQHVPLPWLHTGGEDGFGIVQDSATGDYGLELGFLTSEKDYLKEGKVEIDETDNEYINSLKGSYNNFLDQLSLTDDRFNWLSEYLFGDIDSANFQQAEANIAATEEAQVDSGETIGFTDIGEYYEKDGVMGALGAIGAGAVNAVSSFGASAIQAGTTFGGALLVDMVGSGIRSFNEEKAALNGKTLEELIKDGEAETFIPAVIGGAAYKLEKFGIKGVGKAINGLTNGAKKTLVQTLNAAGKEGGTEYVQGILEEFSTGLGASGNDLDVAGERAAEFATSKEGLESLLQGAVGGGGLSYGGGRLKRVANKIRSKEANKVLETKLEEAFEIDKIISDPNTSNEERAVYKQARKAVQKEIVQATKSANNALRKLNDKELGETEKQLGKIDNIEKKLAAVDKGGAPDETKQLVRNQLAEQYTKEAEKLQTILDSAGRKNKRYEDGTPITAPDKKKKLRVFDFDDTLFSTDANVGVTKADGTKQTLTSEEFATFKPEEGDLLDFSDFVNVRGEKSLDHLDVLAKTVKARDGEGVKILTARPAGAAENIKKALVRSGRVTQEEANRIEVEGIASSDPQDKAKWIRNKIEKEGFGDIYFTDDSQGNIDAVSGDLSTIEGIKFRTQKAGEKAVRGDDSVQRFLKNQIDNLEKSKGAYSAVIPGLDPSTAQAALKVALKSYEALKDLSQAVADAYEWLINNGHDADYLELADAFEKALKEPVSKTNVRDAASETRAQENVQGVKDGDADSWIDLLKQFEPKINKIINTSNWSKNKWAYTAEREDLVNDLNDQLIALARSYDPSVNDSAQAYIFSFLPARIHDILKKYNTQINTEESDGPIKITSKDVDTRPQRGSSKAIVKDLELDAEGISKDVDYVLRKGIDTKAKKWENQVKQDLREEISLKIAEKLGFRPEAGKNKGHWKNEDFLAAVEANFQNLWDALPYSAFANTALKEFGKPVLKANGKPLLLNRKKVVAKEDISFDDFALWINDPSVAASSIRNRKFTFAEALGEVVGWDAMIQKLNDGEYQYRPSLIERTIISLEDVSQQLDKFGRETLGTNPAVVLAKAVIDTAITFLRTGKKVTEAFAKALEINNVSDSQAEAIFESFKNLELEDTVLRHYHAKLMKARFKDAQEAGKDLSVAGREAHRKATEDIGFILGLHKKPTNPTEKVASELSEDAFITKAKGETTEIDPASAGGLAQLQEKAYKGEPAKTNAPTIGYEENARALDKLYETVNPKFWTILAYAEDAKAKDPKGRPGKDVIGRVPAGSARAKKISAKQDVLNWMETKAQEIYGKSYAEVLRDRGETILPLPHGYDKKGLRAATPTHDNFATHLGAFAELVYEMSFDKDNVDINKNIIRSLNRSYIRDISPAVGEQEGTINDPKYKNVLKDPKALRQLGKLHAEHSRPASEIALAAATVLEEAVKTEDPKLRKQQIQKAFSYIADSYFVLHIDKPWNDRFLDESRGKGKENVFLKQDTVIGFNPAGDHALSRYYIQSLIDDANFPVLPPDQVKFYKSGKSILDVFGKDNVAKVAKEIAQKYPELKAEGDQAFNKAVFRELNKDIFEDGLVKAIDKLNSGSLFVEIVPGLTIAKHIVIGGLRAALLAYRGGKKLAEAVKDAYDYISARVDNVNFDDFKSWFDKNVSVIGKPDDTSLVALLDNAPELIKAKKKLSEQTGIKGQDSTADQMEQDFADKQRKDAEEANNAADPAAQKLFNNIVKNAEVQKFAKGKSQTKWSLIPSGAEDFEGLMSVLYGKGDAVKKLITDFLYKPYEQGNNTYIHQKVNILDGFKALKKQHGINRKYLRGDSGVRIKGQKISNGQIARLYQALKHHGDKLDLTKDQKQRVIDAIKNDSKLKAFSEALPKIYRQANSLVGNLEGFVPVSLNRDGKIDFVGNLESDLLTFINKDVRKAAMGAFIQNIDNFLNKSNLDRLEALYGKSYREALDNIKNRMKTGRNRSVEQDKYLGKLLDWVNGSQAVIMFLNLRSAALQSISFVNFIKPSDLKYYAKGFPDKKGLLSTAKMLWNTPYLKDRRRGVKHDIAAEELSDKLFSQSKWERGVGAMSDFGFLPTKLVDSFAIALGGAIFYRARRAEGLNHEEALLAWQSESEKAQQSSRPDRISAQQASSVGRVLLAFANTPLQYARQIKRATGDLANNRGSAADNVSKIVYYGALQSVLFTTLQQMLLNISLDDDEELDDKEKNRLWYGVNSIIDSLLRGTGIIGNATAAIKNAALEQNPEKLWGASPPISSKIDKLKRSKETLQGRYNTRWPYAYALSNTLSAGGNIPADWIYKKAEAAAEIWQNEWGAMNEALRLMGYTKNQLGVEDQSTSKDPFQSGFKPGKKDKFKDSEFDSAFNRGEVGQAFRDGTIEVDPNLSPLEREKTIAHEMEHVKQMEQDGLDYDDDNVFYKGRSHRRKDGKIMYKGKWHIEGAKELPWEAEAYKAESPIKRTGTGTGTGGGETVAEGDKPIGGGVDEDRFDKDGNLITDPKLIDKRLRAADAKADVFTQEWYNAPETRERLKAQTGLTDEQIDERIKQATEVETRSKDIGYADAESHDRGTFMGEVIPEGEPGHFKGRIDVDSAVDPAAYGNKGLLEHEHAHQAGWDNQLGYKAQKILGKGKQGYMNNPAEVYGNMQEFRAILGLKPGQRNLTPAKINAIIKAKGLDDQPDVQQMFYNFDIDKVSEALNTIASASPKKKKSLKDQYA